MKSNSLLFLFLIMLIDGPNGKDNGVWLGGYDKYNLDVFYWVDGTRVGKIQGGGSPQSRDVDMTSTIWMYFIGWMVRMWVRFSWGGSSEQGCGYDKYNLDVELLAAYLTLVKVRSFSAHR